MREPLFLVSIAFLVVGCAIPTRDNRNDPANTPELRVEVAPNAGGQSTEFVFYEGFFFSASEVRASAISAMSPNAAGAASHGGT